MKSSILLALWFVVMPGLASAQDAGKNPDPLLAEISAVRNELNSLRLEVRELTKLLRGELQADAPTPPEPSPSKLTVESCEMALEDCIDLALNNTDILARADSSDSDAAERKTRFQVSNCYWTLWSAYREWELLESSLAKVIDLKQQFGRTPEQISVCEQLAKSILSKTHAAEPWSRESLLREAIGWAAKDGRLIYPTAVAATATWNASWEQTLGHALLHNPKLCGLKRELEELELAITNPTGLSSRDDKIKLARLRQSLREQQQAVASELAVNWRCLEAVKKSARIYKDQRMATGNEIRVLKEKLREPDKLQILESVLRSQEREQMAACMYFKCVAESHKVVCSLTYLCGGKVIQ